MVQYADLPDEVWDNYWQSIYRKTERGFGWILLSLGAIVLLCFGLYEGMSGLYANPEAPLWLKIGLTAGGVGFIALPETVGLIEPVNAQIPAATYSEPDDIGLTAFRAKAAEHEVCVRDRRLLSTATVTDGARIGTGAFRAHPERAPRIQKGDRASPGTHCVNIDHGDFERISGNPRFQGE